MKCGLLKRDKKNLRDKVWAWRTSYTETVQCYSDTNIIENPPQCLKTDINVTAGGEYFAIMFKCCMHIMADLPLSLFSSINDRYIIIQLTPSFMTLEQRLLTLDIGHQLMTFAEVILSQTPSLADTCTGTAHAQQNIFWEKLGARFT